MENKSIDPTCVICHQSIGKPYECVTYCETSTPYKTRRKGSTHYKTSYSCVQKHSGCVCDGCRKRYRLSAIKRWAIFLLISAAVCIVLGLAGNAIDAKPHPNLYGLLMFLWICSLPFPFAALVGLIGCLPGDYGYKALGAYYNEHSSGNRIKTVKAAEKMGLIGTKAAGQPSTVNSGLNNTLQQKESNVCKLADTAEQEAADKPYTLDQGLSELTELFRSYPQLDRQKIQTVGRKIYNAEIPLVSGVGGMHQLYHIFKKRFPAYASELSRIWDGIGDWAD